MSKLEKYNNILTGFGSNILGNFLMFGVTIFLTRTYEPEVYGEFRLIFSFSSLAVIIFLLGRDNGIIYFAQDSHKTSTNNIIQEETYYGFLMLMLGTSILFFLDSWIINNLLNKNVKLEHYYFALLMIPLLGLFNLLLAGLKAIGMINYTAILSNLIQRSLRVPFFLILTIFSTTYYSLALAMILSQIILIYLALKKIPFILNLKTFNIKNFFYRFNYSLQLGVNAIIVVLLTKVDLIMVGKYTDNLQVAIYDICVLLSFTIMFPFIALVKTTEPIMKTLVTIKEIQKKYVKNLKLSIELSLGILLFFIIASEDILSIFGEVYINGSEILIILSVSYMILIILGTPIEVLNMNGFAKLSSIILVISIVINIGLNYFLIPVYGMMGAAIATGVSLFFSKSIGLLIVKIKLNINFIHQLFHFKTYLVFGIFLIIGNQLNINNRIYHILVAICLYTSYNISILLMNKLVDKYE